MEIIYTEDKEDERLHKLVTGLVEFNNSVGPRENHKWFAFYAEDESGNFLGGINGVFEWDYLFISKLWVKEKSKGLGTKLLQKAEDFAKENGKKGAWLDTFEFQAKEFYEKNGYSVFGTIPDAADTFNRFFLLKNF